MRGARGGTTAARLAEERELVALACRVLGRTGLAETTLGHVSMRTTDGILVRARGPNERGLVHTAADDVVLLDADGTLVPGEPPHDLPVELPIHLEVLRARPDVGAVVHAHPPEVVACTVAGIELRPVVGAYNPPAMWLAVHGIPTYAYAGLVRTRERATGMLECMDGRDVCLLQGHGVTSAGPTVEEAVLNAIDVHALARITLAVHQTGRAPIEVDPADRVDLPEDTGSYRRQLWRFYAEEG